MRSLLRTGFIAASLLAGTAVYSQQRPEHHPPQFGFRFLGPVVGNRVAAFAAAPGERNTYYIGAASGGVFKTTDGGAKWNPVFDDQKAAAIGAIAVAPSEPETVWAGTGEAWAIRDIDVAGDGVYKSTDGGKTWTNMGLAGERPHRSHSDRSRKRQQRLCLCARQTGGAAAGSRHLSHRATAARPGSSNCLSMRIPVAQDSRWMQRTPGRYSPEPGRSK